MMYEKIVMEGNAFYEIDEACLRRKEQTEKKSREEKQKGKPVRGGGR